jgi:hypothetical protein
MQQINLYLPEFQPNREPLRSIHMLWGTLIFILLLAVISFASAKHNRELALAVEQQQVQLEQVKNQLKQLEQQRPQHNLAELDVEILRLQQERTRREQIFSIIANKKLGNNTGFSQHLTAMGRQSLDSISLSVFSLQAGGSYIEFAGKTRAADQIPLYIQRLRTEPVFAQSAFGVIDIAPLKGNQEVFEFSLAKQTGAKTPETKTAVQFLLDARGEN